MRLLLFKSGNYEKCPFCNSDRKGKTEVEAVQQIMKRVNVNDTTAMCNLAIYYNNGQLGFQQDHAKARQIHKQAAELGSSRAHCHLGHEYHLGGDLKKAKFHWEAAAMAGNEDARCGLGLMEFESGNKERAVKHLTIAASAGDPRAMHELTLAFEAGHVSKESINSTLTAYNNSCAEMRSEARDAYICVAMEMNEST